MSFETFEHLINSRIRDEILRAVEINTKILFQNISFPCYFPEILTLQNILQYKDSINLNILRLKYHWFYKICEGGELNYDAVSDLMHN